VTELRSRSDRWGAGRDTRGRVCSQIRLHTYRQLNEPFATHIGTGSRRFVITIRLGEVRFGGLVGALFG
jgi:hypothetical protein